MPSENLIWAFCSGDLKYGSFILNYQLFVKTMKSPLLAIWHTIWDTSYSSNRISGPIFSLRFEKIFEDRTSLHENNFCLVIFLLHKICYRLNLHVSFSTIIHFITVYIQLYNICSKWILCPYRLTISESEANVAKY